MNLQVIATLCAVAIVQEDNELLDAALTEIRNMSIDQRAIQDKSGDTVHLLASQKLLHVSLLLAHLHNGSLTPFRPHFAHQDDYTGALSSYAHAFHAQPTSHKAHRAFHQAVSQRSSALMADTTDDLTSEKEALHSVHLRPWRMGEWLRLRNASNT